MPGLLHRGVRARFHCYVLLTGLLGCGIGEGPTGVEPVDEPAAPPRAAEYRSARVDEALDAASEMVLTRGFEHVDSERRGFLVDQAADVREQSMRSGTCYLVLAAGSSAIRELDVRVFDSAGGEMVQDSTDGARAAVNFCPAQHGTYYVAVQASAGSGLFAARSFRGPTGLDVRTDDLFRDSAVEGAP